MKQVLPRLLSPQIPGELEDCEYCEPREFSEVIMPADGCIEVLAGGEPNTLGEAGVEVVVLKLVLLLLERERLRVCRGHDPSSDFCSIASTDPVLMLRS